MTFSNTLFLLYILPNYVLALVMYTLLGRFLLGLFVPEGSGNYILKFFGLITNPVLALVRPITPSIVPHGVLLLLALLWVFFARIGLFLAIQNAGLLPTVAP
jgi:uncharacterized protein YggT (Ycf19 family)